MGLLSCTKTTPIPIPDASHSTSKALVKYGKANTGADQSLSFNKLKALSCSSFHLKPTEFFAISIKGITMVLKSFTNLDTIQERSNSDFDVKCATIQFYGNSHNSQSDRWIDLNFYVQSPNMFSYLGIKFQVNQSSGRHRNTGQQRLYEFCYLFSFDLWTSYLARILFLKGCGSWFWEFSSSTRIFNELQYNLQVWQGFLNVLKSFSYKDSSFILATQGKKS